MTTVEAKIIRQHNKQLLEKLYKLNQEYNKLIKMCARRSQEGCDIDTDCKYVSDTSRGFEEGKCWPSPQHGYKRVTCSRIRDQLGGDEHGVTDWNYTRFADEDNANLFDKYVKMLGGETLGVQRFLDVVKPWQVYWRGC